MKRTLWMPATVAALALAAAPARAQLLPLAFEVRGGVTSPTGDFANGTKSGLGLTGTIEFRVLPLPVVYLYGGYGLDRFGSDDPNAPDVDYESRGYLVGGRVSAPTLFGALPVVPWARVGATFSELKISRRNVSLTSDRKTGLDVGLGIEFQAAPMVKVVPGATYRSYRPAFNNQQSTARVTYWVFDVGVRVAL